MSVTSRGLIDGVRIPLADPRADLVSLRDEVLSSIARVVDSGRYILGPEVEAFEAAMTTRLGVAGSAGVASGTDALILGLLAVGAGHDTEVITVSHTAGPTVAAIHATGATPVLVDVEQETFCLDPAKLAAAIGSKTKAILPVHLYGHPADMSRISEIASALGVSVVEDCAQAQDASIGGRPVGSFGDVGCFSFYPTKNLGALGDGGLVSAKDPRTLDRIRQLRTYGWTKPQFAELPNGRCSRLDEMQAAILNVKLMQLAAHIDTRRTIARRYDDAFADLPISTPTERANCRHVFHLYVMRTSSRDHLARHLAENGIDSGVHYPIPVHLQPGLAAGCRIPERLTITEASVSEIISIPIYPSLSRGAQDKVIAAVRSFFERS